MMFTNYTERMVPEQAHARIFWEHVARYRFAKDFVSGKRVARYRLRRWLWSRSTCQGWGVERGRD